MTMRTTIKALIVLSLTCFATSLKANSLTLRNDTGFPVAFRLHNNLGQLLPGGSGCLGPQPHTVFGPAYAHRELGVVSGLILHGHITDGCRGSSIAYTPHQPPFRMNAGKTMTVTFTYVNRQAAVSYPR